jgi:hypothetical protein
MDTERNRKNIEAKKRRSNYEQMEEQIDEYGQVFNDKLIYFIFLL